MRVPVGMVGAMYAAILAGGSGTRFWPLSRRDHPKQLLELTEGSPTLVAQTVERLAPLVPESHCRIICGRSHDAPIAQVLPRIPRLVEPAARNTAAPVALACLWAQMEAPDAVVAILPADHHIRDEAGFRAALASAEAAAADGAIVTLGIQPTRPETGYGYIEVGEPLGEGPARKVVAFREKPDTAGAEAYLAGGRHLWNAGIFVFRADVMWAELERHIPELTSALATVTDVGDSAGLEQAWAAVPRISIDYAVMEKTDRAAVIPADVGWSDVGSFAALPEVQGVDAEGNLRVGDTLVLDTTGSIVESRGGRLVALVGCEDLVVVDTADAVLVVPRAQAQRVRDLVTALEDAGREDVL